MAETNGGMLTKNVLALVQGSMLMAIAFVGGQLWATNNEVRELKGDLKYLIGQLSRIDRLTDDVHRLELGTVARDGRLEELTRSRDLHRDELIRMQKELGLAPDRRPP
jgi:hypothetical protein